jgi:succinate dehydrogenase / fumarate reductase flavoprotein subunit
MGGIPTNVSAEVVVDAAGTVVPGLYAAGECACVSVHGANRLGTNSLLDIVVFGRRGGAATAAFAAANPAPAWPSGAEDGARELVEAQRAGSGRERVADVRSDLQAAMSEKASVFRTAEGLADVRSTIGELRARYREVAVEDAGERFNYELVEALELGFLLDLAECLVVSAEARTESRGGHFRDDHPLRDDANWLRHTLAHRDEAGRFRLEYKPVEGGPYLPMERKY